MAVCKSIWWYTFSSLIFCTTDICSNIQLQCLDMVLMQLKAQSWCWSLLFGSNLDACDWFWLFVANFINKISICLLLSTFPALCYLQWLDSNRRHTELISSFLQLPSCQVHIRQRQQTIQLFTRLIVCFFPSLSFYCCDMQRTDKWNLFASKHLIFLIEGHLSFVFRLREDYVSRNFHETPFKRGW